MVVHTQYSRDSIRNSTMVFNAIEIEFKIYRLISFGGAAAAAAAPMMYIFAIYMSTFTSLHICEYFNHIVVSLALSVDEH